LKIDFVRRRPIEPLVRRMDEMKQVFSKRDRGRLRKTVGNT